MGEAESLSFVAVYPVNIISISVIIFQGFLFLLCGDNNYFYIAQIISLICSSSSPHTCSNYLVICSNDGRLKLNCTYVGVLLKQYHRFIIINTIISDND